MCCNAAFSSQHYLNSTTVYWRQETLMTVLEGFTFDSPVSTTGSPVSTTGSPILDGKLTQSMARSLIECAVLSYKNRSQVEAALKPDKDKGHLLRFEWFEAVGRTFDSQGFACIVPGHVIL